MLEQFKFCGNEFTVNRPTKSGHLVSVKASWGIVLFPASLLESPTIEWIVKDGVKVK